jgi:predicted deacylase
MVAVIRRTDSISSIVDIKLGINTSTYDIEPGNHLIAAFSGNGTGPTLIVVAGLHGNERAGVAALLRAAEDLTALEANLPGRVYFLAGNTRALKKGVRFIDADLNRSWTIKNLSPAAVDGFSDTSESTELSELNELIDAILITAKKEVFVLDLHSTSADGIPFATVGDTMRNRRFAEMFDVSSILGIEEQLDGTMLEYLNNAGAVTLGFEGGQHYSATTVDNHESFVWDALYNSGVLKATPMLAGKRHPLHVSKKLGKILEIRYRHPVQNSDEFKMEAGFDNFDPIIKGQVMARDRNGPVRAPESGLLLMPLYQKLGEDGFFIARHVAPFWLSLSAVLRSAGVPTMVSFLPGVSKDPDDPETLVINTKVARLFPLQVFHLLGFRRKRWVGERLIVSRRKHDVSSPFLAFGNK